MATAVVALVLAMRPFETVEMAQYRRNVISFALADRDFEEAIRQLLRWRATSSEQPQDVASLSEVDHLDLLVAVVHAHAGDADRAKGLVATSRSR